MTDLRSPVATFPPPDAPVFPPPDAPPAMAPPVPEAPPPRRTRRFILFGALAAIVLGAALAAFLLLRPGGGAEITTPAGTLTIDEVEMTDQWPPGCGELSQTCSHAAPGYVVLVVWFEAPGGDVSELSREIMDVALGDSQAYVEDATGARTEAFAGGVVDRRPVIAFTPEEGTTGFTLHWPGNEPIDLEV